MSSSLSINNPKDIICDSIWFLYQNNLESSEDVIVSMGGRTNRVGKTLGSTLNSNFVFNIVSVTVRILFCTSLTAVEKYKKNAYYDAVHGKGTVTTFWLGHHIVMQSSIHHEHSYIEAAILEVMLGGRARGAVGGCL